MRPEVEVIVCGSEYDHDNALRQYIPLPRKGDAYWKNDGAEDVGTANRDATGWNGSPWLVDRVLLGIEDLVRDAEVQELGKGPEDAANEVGWRGMRSRKI